jgi:hypothetical protein
VKSIARSISIPLMANADTGYGNPVTIYHVVQMFGEAGVVGINIEDQVSPKRCGHMCGKELVDAREAAKKIEAAVKAKQDAGFIINARTDAIAVEGIGGAIARAKMYRDAGADMVYQDAIASEYQIQRFVDAVEAPVSVKMGFGIRSRPTTPLVPVRRLQELGVARVSYARMLPAAALMGMRRALEIFRDGIERGVSDDRPDIRVGIRGNRRPDGLSDDRPAGGGVPASGGDRAQIWRRRKELCRAVVIVCSTKGAVTKREASMAIQQRQRIPVASRIECCLRRATRRIFSC